VIERHLIVVVVEVDVAAEGRLVAARRSGRRGLAAALPSRSSSYSV
jgi:hypothetical protein